MEPTDISSDPAAAALRMHLAQRDSACPGCGYNLRGTAEDRCPECGRALELQVALAGSVSTWRWFLLLAFGWPALAAAFTGASYARMIHTIVWAPRLQAARGLTFNTSAVRASMSPTGQATFQMNSITTGFGRPATVPALAWGSVDTVTWVELALGIGLALVGLTGLLAPGANLEAALRQARVRRLVIAATLTFAVYGLWEISLAVRFLV